MTFREPEGYPNFTSKVTFYFPSQWFLINQSYPILSSAGTIDTQHIN